MFSRAASWTAASAGPSRTQRRSKALTSPFIRGSARPTAVSTAAWAGTFSNRNCAMPSIDSSRVRAARRGRGRSRNRSSSASICPARRSVVAAMRRAKARTSGLSLSGPASSSGRPSSRTEASRSRASARAAPPLTPRDPCGAAPASRRRRSARCPPAGRGAAAARRPSPSAPAPGSPSRDGWRTAGRPHAHAAGSR